MASLLSNLSAASAVSDSDILYIVQGAGSTEGKVTRLQLLSDIGNMSIDVDATNNPTMLITAPTIPQKSITNVAYVNSTATLTITTSTSHGYAVNEEVKVLLDNNPLYNGIFVVFTVPTSTTFTANLRPYLPDLASTADTGTVVLIKPITSIQDPTNSNAVIGSLYSDSSIQLRSGNSIGGSSVSAAFAGPVFTIAGPPGNAGLVQTGSGVNYLLSLQMGNKGSGHGDGIGILFGVNPSWSRIYQESDNFNTTGTALRLEASNTSTSQVYMFTGSLVVNGYGVQTNLPTRFDGVSHPGLLSAHDSGLTAYGIPRSPVPLTTMPLPITETINNVSLTSNVATLTCTQPHLYVIGTTVVVSGLTNSFFNGTYVVTAITPTTFSYSLTHANVSPTSDSGSVAYSNTANLQEWCNSAGVLLSSVDKTGAFKPVSLADSAAPNSSIYFSTTASKLVYKDGSGTVNNLY